MRSHNMQAFCAECGKELYAGHYPYCVYYAPPRPKPRRWAALALAAVALLLCGGRAAGQDAVPLSVKGGGAKVIEVDRSVIVKVNVTVVSSFPFTVQAAPGAGLYFWQIPPGVTALDRNDSLEVTNAPKGDVTFGVKMIGANLDKDGKFIGFVTRFGSVTLTVDGVPGPDPKPPPMPDPPKPDPGPVKGLRVLIVYETADLSKMSPAQNAVLYSKVVRDYLSAKCVLESDGKTRGYRIFDKDVDASADARGWAELLRRQRTAVPWLVVADGSVVVYEGPLPANTEATLALLRKWGG